MRAALARGQRTLVDMRRCLRWRGAVNESVADHSGAEARRQRGKEGSGCRC